jgi:phage baseplate assembly protein gpV
MPTIHTGIIASIDLSTCTATVTIAEGLITHPLPWLSPRFGGVQVWSPPSVGETVILLCEGDSLDTAMILPALCLSKPTGFAEGEQGVRFADGSLIKHSAGSLTLIAASIQLQGNVSVQGSLSTTAEATIAGKPFSTHRHSGVQTGGGSTGGVVF